MLTMWYFPFSAFLRADGEILLWGSFRNNFTKNLLYIHPLVFSPYYVAVHSESYSLYAYFFPYLEANYFGVCSPCGVSPSACFIVLMVKDCWWCSFRISSYFETFLFSPRRTFLLCVLSRL